jgi:hypothetical protein
MILLTGLLTACISPSSVTTFKRDDGFTNMFSHEGNFSALMPAKPKRSVKKTVSRIGDLHNFIYSCIVDKKENESFFYLISYVDYPDTLIQAINSRILIRNTAMESMNRFNKAKLIAEKNISIQNNPGYEVIFTGYQRNKGKLIMAKERIFLVKNRMYVLLMLTEAFNNHNIADRFFDSFQITTNI